MKNAVNRRQALNVVSGAFASPLARKATLVSVDISQWTARKLDRKVTKETNESHGASEDAGRYNKLLIEANRMKKLTKLVSEARALHYKYTKPWADEGLRILPNAVHEKFANEFRRIKRDFDEAADEFCAEFPAYVEERKRKLNGMFDAADYPDPSEIRSKFRMRHHTFPVPDAGDFRSEGLDENMIAAIRSDLEETSGRVLNDAMQHTAEQVAKVVGHMAEKLNEHLNKNKGDRKFFTDSLVENVRELAELLPAFNLTDDPKLNKITQRIKKELCVEEAQVLRDNEEACETVQKSAEDILRDVNVLLG